MEVTDVAKIIDWPEHQWPGNCYAVALKLLEHNLVPNGVARYGHYTGPIEPGTMFDRRPIVVHGWIECADGSVVDPTRWVFEDEDPYIYEGPNDFYDVAGDSYRHANERPCPERKPGDEATYLRLPPRIAVMLPNPPWLISRNQLFWLANLSLRTLGYDAKDVYEELIAHDLVALIPIDNRMYVLGQQP